jgi:hypothetical protein
VLNNHPHLTSSFGIIASHDDACFGLYDYGAANFVGLLVRASKQKRVTATEQTRPSATILKCVARLALCSEYDIGQKPIRAKAM